MSTHYELSTTADYNENDAATLVPQQRETRLSQRAPWYQHPTLLWILRSTAINFVLPFFNGVMLGFGEILANELVFKFGWFGFSRVSPSTALGLRPGVPPSSTAEYKKALQSEMKRLDKQME